MVQRDRKQKVKKRKNWFLVFSKNGIIQSFLVHICIFLCLALTFTAVDKQHALKLSVNFETEEELDVEPFVIEIPQPEITEAEEELNNIVALDDDVVELKVDMLEELTESPPSLAVENISMDMVNSTITQTTSNSVVPKASTVRNRPTSSSYGNRFNAMMTGKLDDRLEKHGAHTGAIQISISWDDYNDVDLWVEFRPFHSRNNVHTIGWTNRESVGGYLDIDMNVQPFTNEPVENVVWPHNRSPYGTYTVYAHYYHQWDRNNTTTVYLRVKHDDEIVYRKSTVSFGRGPQKIYTFTRKPSKFK